MRRRTAAFDTVPSSATATKVLRRLRSIVQIYASPAWNTSTIMHWTWSHSGGMFANKLYRLPHSAERCDHEDQDINGLLLPHLYERLTRDDHHGEQ
jgi:hypothetical protein